MFPIRKKIPILLLLFLFVLLVSCGGDESAIQGLAAPEMAEVAVEVTRVVTETMIETIEDAESKDAPAEGAESDAISAATAVSNQPTSPNNSASTPMARLIIKDGRMIVIVEDTETAVDRAIGLTVDLGGYLISQQVYNDEEGYRFATLQLAVPVLTFEDAMRSLRRLGTVTDESASGDDVTEEFTDLNSRIANLEATRDRLLEFLEQAETIEQSLEVNEQLKIIEEDIAVIEGRVNFLRERASFSTISLTINPWIPTSTPSPTPTFTPSPTPTQPPTAEAWRPADTAQTAKTQLQNTSQSVADVLIYTGIVCGPWLILLAILAFAVWKVMNYWTGRQQATGEVERE